MARESYAESVARHVEVLYTLFMEVNDLRHTEAEVKGIIKTFITTVGELERLTALRIEASTYEYQRREGKRLAQLAMVVAPRG